MNQFPINHEYYNIIFNLWEEKPVTAFSLAQLLYNNIHLSLPSMFWFQCFPFANCLFGVRTNTFTHHCFGDSFRFLSVISLLLTERKHKKAWNSPGSEWMASMGMWSQHSGFFLRRPSGWCLWLCFRQPDAQERCWGDFTLTPNSCICPQEQLVSTVDTAVSGSSHYC